MKLLPIFVCFSTFLQASLSIPLWASKPQPVDLEFICTTIFDPNNKDFKHDDVPVILLHGLTGNKESWHGVYEVIALETRKKVCAVDLRNHGQSPWNDKEYDVVAMTEDVKHLMDRIDAPKAIVLGHSLGGRIAVHLALNYPERVEKVIVEDMRPNGITPKGLKGVQFYSFVLKEIEKLIPQGVTEKEAKKHVLALLTDHLAKLNITYQLNDPNLIPVKCSNGKCQLSTNPVLLDAALRNITDLLNTSSGRFDGPALFIYGTESSIKVKLEMRKRCNHRNSRFQ
ncbi:unnamed protein product [Larinioides sclopetarius]|uniref:sn-1-specific diacylglycerol lipase ABHD11 n=1 Tax=Larinioides sclopetarius TaxID=280406 RepID=A0AAV2AJP0_9ARAC